MPENRRPTQADVARLAGVSQSMVSYILNDNTNLKIPEETRQKVFDAMRQLGYVPNSLAQSLRSGQTHTLGLVVPDNSNLFFAEIARQIEEIVFQHGYSLILCNTDGDARRESSHVDVLIAKQTDGIIFISANGSTRALKKLHRSGIPYVIADRDIEGIPADLVLVDNQLGGYLATKHLVDQGLRNIACITGPLRTSSGARIQGYEKALSEASLPVDPRMIIPGDFRIEGGISGMNAIFDAGFRPDGVFACNDMMAIGAMRSIRSHGLHIPQDISIVGFDDTILAQAIDPQLTTISQPIPEIVKEVTRLIFIRIQNKREGVRENEIQRTILQPRLVVRDSTRRLPA